MLAGQGAGRRAGTQAQPHLAPPRSKATSQASSAFAASASGREQPECWASLRRATGRGSHGLRGALARRAPPAQCWVSASRLRRCRTLTAVPLTRQTLVL